MSSVFDARARSGPQFPQRRALRKGRAYADGGPFDSHVRKSDAEALRQRFLNFKPAPPSDEALAMAARMLAVQEKDPTLKKADGGQIPGYFLGGLFSGTPGSSSSYQTSSSNFNIADPNYNSMKDYVLSSGLDLIKNSKFTPYGSNPVVGLTPEQQRGIDTASANVGNYSPFYNNAGSTLDRVSGAFDPSKGQNMVDQAAGMQTGTGAASPFIQNGSQNFPSAVGQYMSPYTDNVVKGIQDASNRNFEQNTMRTINDTISGGAAAQFGRENHGNAVGNAVFAKTQADDAAVANALESGYSTAGNLFNQDQSRQLQAGQLSGSLAQGDIAQRAGLGQTAAGIQGANTASGTGLAQGQVGLGQNVQNSGLADSNALLQAGAVDQTTKQNQSNFDYNEFQQKLQYPFQLLNYGQGLSQGWQLPTNTNSTSYGTSTVTQPQGSPFGQIMGAATSLAGMAVPGAGGTSAMGNIFSGIRGLFAQGGMVPTVREMRKSANPNRGMQPTGMPGMPPMAPMAPNGPQPNGQMTSRPFRRGGFVGSPFHGAR